MKKVDRRIQRTRQALRDALIALVLETGYEPITIRDLTDRANIAYATFFRHYRDKDGLLGHVLQALIGEIRDLMTPDQSPEMEGLALFRHVQAHEQLYRVLLSNRGPQHLLQRLLEMAAGDVVRTYDSHASSVIPVEVAANHFITAAFALVKWWLDHDKPYPPERMAQIYSVLIANATRYALGFTAE